MKNSITKQILCASIILLFIFTMSGCSKESSSATDPNTHTEVPTNPPNNSETPAEYAIDYEIQGYLFKQNQYERVYIEDAIFTARNPSLPQILTGEEVNSKKTSFEHISLRGFPSIEDETALSTYTRDSGNGLLEVHVSKSGGIRDKNTGAMKLITEVQYILFIDKETNALLLCQIFAEMDGETQQYFFSPQRNPDHINDILIRAYTT